MGTAYRQGTNALKSENPGDDLLSLRGSPASTIGAEGLNCRVRNGNGCDPFAQITRELSLRTTYQDFVGGSQVTRAISIGRLKTSRSLHPRPINLMISEGPSGPFNTDGIPNLGVGFTLRCFQRLSDPNVDTQRCAWRHNWYTRGSSIPVLSY